MGVFFAFGFDVERSEFGIDVCHRRWIVKRRGAEFLDQFDAPGASVVVGGDELLKFLGFFELVESRLRLSNGFPPMRVNPSARSWPDNPSNVALIVAMSLLPVEQISSRRAMNSSRLRRSDVDASLATGVNDSARSVVAGPADWDAPSEPQAATINISANRGLSSCSSPNLSTTLW